MFSRRGIKIKGMFRVTRSNNVCKVIIHSYIILHKRIGKWRITVIIVDIITVLRVNRG